jgi:hypothetical protein
VVEALQTEPATCPQVTLSGELPANPEPVNVTVVPAGPWFGAMTREVETENEATVVWPWASVAVNE